MPWIRMAFDFSVDTKHNQNQYIIIIQWIHPKWKVKQKGSESAGLAEKVVIVYFSRVLLFDFLGPLFTIIWTI